MTEVDRLLNLLYEMELALKANDVDKVSDIQSRQLASLQELSSRAEQDPVLIEQLRGRMDEINRQVGRNEQLLKQGLAISDALVKQLFSSRTKANNQSVYSYRA